MEPTSSASTRTTRWLLAVLVALNLYRAATQSLTTDEAFTFNDFVAPALGKMFLRFDANNHVLYTLLAKLSVAAFGLSEFTVRLPSVLGGGLYLVMAYRLSRRLFDRGALFLAALGLLALNPLLLDYLSAARGYGLALALWMTALVLLLDCLETIAPRRLYWAGISLALSVAANLTLAFPAAALGFAFAVIVLARRRIGVFRLIEQFVIPGLVLDFVILLLPLLPAEPGKFYYGSRTLAEALYSITALSLIHDGFRPALLGVTIAPAPFLAALTPVICAIAAAVMAALLWVVVRGDARARLTGGAAFLTLALLAAAHHAAGILYPSTRTGLYWIPLLSLAALLPARHFGRRWLTAATVIAAALVTLQYASQLEVTFYGEWQDEQGIAALARFIQDSAAGHPVRIAATWPADLTMEFYRRRLRLTGCPAVVRPAKGDAFDFYLLLPRDYALLEQRHLRVLARRGPALLAAP